MPARRSEAVPALKKLAGTVDRQVTALGDRTLPAPRRFTVATELAQLGVSVQGEAANARQEIVRELQAEGKTMPQIAETLGISAAVVAKLAHRGRYTREGRLRPDIEGQSPRKPREADQ